MLATDFAGILELLDSCGGPVVLSTFACERTGLFELGNLCT
jgi:hypothetical protein